MHVVNLISTYTGIESFIIIYQLRVYKQDIDFAITHPWKILTFFTVSCSPSQGSIGHCRIPPIYDWEITELTAADEQSKIKEL